MLPVARFLPCPVFLILFLILAGPATASPSPEPAPPETPLAGLARFELAWSRIVGARLAVETGSAESPARAAARRIASAARSLGADIGSAQERDDAVRSLAGEILEAARALGARPAQTLEVSLALRRELRPLLATLPEAAGPEASVPAGRAAESAPAAVAARLGLELREPLRGAPR